MIEVIMGVIVILAAFLLVGFMLVMFLELCENIKAIRNKLAPKEEGGHK